MVNYLISLCSHLKQNLNFGKIVNYVFTGKLFPLMLCFEIIPLHMICKQR